MHTPLLARIYTKYILFIRQTQKMVFFKELATTLQNPTVQLPMKKKKLANLSHNHKFFETFL